MKSEEENEQGASDTDEYILNNEKGNVGSADTATPYPHQVGGHGQLAMTTSGHLLKPLLDKEHQFYLYIQRTDLPSDLQWIRQVTPTYYGETTYPNLINHHNNHNQQPEQQQQQQQQQQHYQNNHNQDHQSGECILRWKSNNSNHPHGHERMSPWIQQVCARKTPGISNRKRRPSRSIALEDITRNFRCPCVLDCKLGTRQYDDDATAAKRARHIDKARRTTSMACGVRYTGMQSWKEDSGMFELRDKYRGRELKQVDLIPELQWFFNNGKLIRVDCILQILQQLLTLRRYHVTQQTHFFFYSSSLLLVYEGDSTLDTRVDVRMIDFAHTVLSHGKRDDGYLKGINYLIHILSEILISGR